MTKVDFATTCKMLSGESLVFFAGRDDGSMSGPAIKARIAKDEIRARIRDGFIDGLDFASCVAA